MHLKTTRHIMKVHKNILKIVCTGDRSCIMAYKTNKLIAFSNIMNTSLKT